MSGVVHSNGVLPTPLPILVCDLFYFFLTSNTEGCGVSTKEDVRKAPADIPEVGVKDDHEQCSMTVMTTEVTSLITQPYLSTG